MAGFKLECPAGFVGIRSGGADKCQRSLHVCRKHVPSTASMTASRTPKRCSPHLRRELELVPVSEWANNARHDDQRCLEPR